MSTQQIRPIVLALLAALAAFGWISPELRAVVEQNADAIIAGILAAWAVVAHLRNRRDAAPAGRLL